MNYQIKLPLPPTLNQQINEARTHWRRSAATKKLWTSKISVLLRDAPRFPDIVWLEYLWIVSFRNDPDNCAAAAKFINDGLTKAGVIKSDNLIIIQSPVIHNYQKKGKSEVDSVVLMISDRITGKL